VRKHSTEEQILRLILLCGWILVDTWIAQVLHVSVYSWMFWLLALALAVPFVWGVNFLLSHLWDRRP
jgi:membrane protein CcdC involved in cytochrome C biogenesis